MTIDRGHWGLARPTIDNEILTDADAVDRANGLTCLNRSMAAKLGEGFFDNPVQMMLLELFVARIKQRRVTVKVLALSSGVPTSTAQRWIDRMEARHMIRKQINGGDRRSFVVTIEDATFASVRALLAAMGGIGRG